MPELPDNPTEKPTAAPLPLPGADMTAWRGALISGLALIAFSLFLSLGEWLRGQEGAPLDPWSEALAFAAAFPLALFVGLMRFGGGRSVTELLGLRRWPLGAMGAALLLGGSLSAPLSELENLVRQVAPYSKEVTAQMLAPRSVVGEAVAAGLVMPLCTELLFRGLLARAFIPRLGAGQGIALAAALGAFVTCLGAYTYIPTELVFGIVSGWLVLRSDSLGPTLAAALGCFAAPFVFTARGVIVAGYNMSSSTVLHVPARLLDASLAGAAVSVALVLASTRRSSGMRGIP